MNRTTHGVTYEKAGQGEPVVLLHGIGSNSRSWRRQLEFLSDWYTAVAWDAPGYGGSFDPDHSWQMADYAASLNTFLDDLELDRIHLVGLSMGGVIAAEFCRLHQDRLLSLLLADTHRGGAAKDPPEAQDRALNDRLMAFRTKSREQFARERVPRLLSPEASPHLIEDAVDIMKEVRSPGYEIAAIALAKSDVRDMLPKIYIPTLVICGELDRVCPPEEAKRIAAAIPAARLELIPGAGHLSNQERPTEFNSAMRRHLSAP